MKKLFIPLLVLVFACMHAYAKLSIQNQIIGLEGPVLENVNKRLQAQQTLHGRELTADMIFRWYEMGPHHIRKAMQPYGYFNPEIIPQLVQDNNNWTATYRIKPGPTTRIKQVDLRISGEGAHLPRFQEISKELPLKDGEVFLSENYTEAKKRLFDIANELGFLHASLTRSEVQVDAEQNQATIVIYFDTGKRYYFGKIQFSQTPDVLADSFLRRFLHVQPGDYFSSDELIEMQQDYINSNYFEYVSINPQFDDINGQQIPIDVELVPYKAQQYLFGIGYGTDSGLRGTVGINFRRLTPYGHQLKLISQLNREFQNIKGIFKIPAWDPTREFFAINGSLERITPQTFVGEIGKLGFAYVYEYDEWLINLGINLLHDRKNQGFINFSQDPLPGHVTTFYPSVNINYITSDNPIAPKYGVRAYITVLGANRRVWSDVDFMQINLGGKVIYSFWEGTRLITRGNFAHTSIAGDQALPLPFTLFAGGTESVRGYPYQHIGPGKSQLTGSVELQQNIFGDWYIGGFLDAGNVYKDKIRVGDMRRSYGVSLIYMSGIGPLKLSLAKPIRDADKNKIEVHFSIGPDL
jgi:translocation and assembly module TamA